MNAHTVHGGRDTICSARKVLAASAVLTLSACSPSASPVPPDRIAYVGTWEYGTYAADSNHEYVFLKITQDGFVSYARSFVEDNRSSCTTLKPVPLAAITDETIEAALLLGFTMDFEVNAPPQDVGGAWKMTIDGYELSKTDASQLGSAYPWDCDDDD